MKSLRIKVLPEKISVKNKAYLNAVKELLSSSTLEYILSPFRSRRFLVKLIWILFLLVFLVTSIYYVTLNIFEYLQYETNTSIYEIREKEAEFPAISFCDTRDFDFNAKIILFKYQNEDLVGEWKEHLQSFTDTTFGKCYRFNSGFNWSNQSIPMKKLIRSGITNGFWLNFYHNSTSDYGLLTIYIHNNTEKPETIFHKGYYFSSGSYNFFNVKRIQDQKLESPYNNCFQNVSNSNYNQTIINKMNDYTQKECVNLCINLKFNEMNPCNLTFKEDVFKSTNKCVRLFIKNSNVSEKCLKKYCPLECGSLTYDIIKDSTTITGQGAINPSKSSNTFAGFNTYENLSKTFFGIRVYYQDLKYTLISQHPKIETFDLISSVGGTLGLFLGFSFISFLELFEVLAELIYISFE
jgi:hypothetical protein